MSGPTKPTSLHIRELSHEFHPSSSFETSDTETEAIVKEQDQTPVQKGHFKIAQKYDIRAEHQTRILC